MRPALLLLITVWRAAALQHVHPAGHDPSPASNFRLVVPRAVAQDDEPPYISVAHMNQLFTLHDRDVITYDLDTKHGRLLPTSHAHAANTWGRDVAKHDRDIAQYHRDRIYHDRDLIKQEFDTRDVSNHDRDHRWIKINLYGLGDRDNLHDRDNLYDRDNLHDRGNKLLEHNAKLHDQDNNWVDVYGLKDRHPTLHDGHKENTLVDGNNVELYDHKGELHDRADRGVKDIKHHGHEVIVVEDDSPRYTVYPAGERGARDGAFSEIPSSEFTRDDAEHRPSVKKDLSADGLWLDSVCQSMHHRSTPDSWRPRPRPACDVCCVLHRQLAESARHPGPRLHHADPAPEGVLAELAPPDPESTPEELLTVLGRTLAERRDWHVLNSEHPDRMKQYVLIHKNGSLVV